MCIRDSGEAGGREAIQDLPAVEEPGGEGAILVPEAMQAAASMDTLMGAGSIFDAAGAVQSTESPDIISTAEVNLTLEEMAAGTAQMATGDGGFRVLAEDGKAAGAERKELRPEDLAGGSGKDQGISELYRNLNAESVSKQESSGTASGGEGEKETFSEMVKYQAEQLRAMTHEMCIRDRIMNVLTLAYPPSQIRVSATVVIDYDRMITEDLQYEPQDNGQGVVDKFKEGQTVNGSGGGAGGVAGEENNTDIPTYGAAGNGGFNQSGGEYYRDVEYLVGYIKKQIEKDNVKLQKATVAITVNDNNLTEAKKQQLIDAASKAANILPEDIVVSSFQQIETEKAAEPVTPVVPVQAPVLAGVDYRLLAVSYTHLDVYKRQDQTVDGMTGQAEDLLKQLLKLTEKG